MAEIATTTVEGPWAHLDIFNEPSDPDMVDHLRRKRESLESQVTERSHRVLSLQLSLDNMKASTNAAHHVMHCCTTPAQLCSGRRSCLLLVECFYDSTWIDTENISPILGCELILAVETRLEQFCNFKRDTSYVQYLV